MITYLYDFDDTIYNGDSMIDFYAYSLRRRPALLRYFPYQLWHALLFLFSLEDRTTFKGNFLIFIKGIDRLDRYVTEFWERYEKNLKTWYITKNHTDEVIVSASPEFLLAPIAKKLGVRKLVATRVDTGTGRVEGHNCYGLEKVLRIKEELPGIVVKETYTDSISDAPILAMAVHKYIVKGDQIMTLEHFESLTKLQRLSLRF